MFEVDNGAMFKVRLLRFWTLERACMCITSVYACVLHVSCFNGLSFYISRKGMHFEPACCKIFEYS